MNFENTYPNVRESSLEKFMDLHEVSQVALRDAANEFITSRGHRERVAAGGSFTTHEALESGLESLRANYDLLEDVGEKREEEESEPVCTVCIPVAVLREPAEAVARLVETAGSSAHGPVEVVLWANAKFDDETEETIRLEAKSKYEILRKSVETVNPDIRVRTALQVLPKEEATMSKVRSNFMDAVIMEGVERGYEFEHPVVWLDADTVAASNNMLEELSSAVRSQDALFVHADARFSLDWASGRPLSELDDAAKAVAVNEIHRRQIIRGLAPHETVGYIEESGLAFGLGTYLCADGIDTSDPINEAARLMMNASEVNDTKRGGLIPWRLQLSNDPVELIKVVKTARIENSARRHYEVAKQEGAIGLFDIDSSRYGKKLFTDMTQIDPKDISIPKAHMRGLRKQNGISMEGQIAAQRGAGYAKTPEQVAREERSARVGHLLIDRYFKK